MNNTHLFKGIKIIQKRDSGRLRVSMFNSYLDNNMVAKNIELFCRTHKLSFTTTVLYSFWYFSKLSRLTIVGGHNAILSTYEYKNESNAINSFCSKYNITGVSFLTNKRISVASLFTVFTKIKFNKLKQSFRILKYLKRKYSFLVICRSLEYFAYFFYLESTLRKGSVKTIICSSDVNPNGVSLIAYGNKLNLKSIFFNHGLVIKPLPRLDYSLSVLNCPADAAVYDVHDKSRDRVVVATGDRVVKINSVKEVGLSAGIFLTTFPNVKEVILVCRKLIELGVNVKFIRPHPNELTIKKEDLRSLRKTFPEINTTNCVPIDLVFNHIDFVIAGNTSAHIDALKKGVPSVYIRELDFDPFDVFKFVENGLLPHLENINIDSLPKLLNDFFQNYKWSDSAKFYGVYQNVEYLGLEERVRDLLSS